MRDTWIEDVIARHTASMTRPEFLKAVRALSARYVEQRATLREKSPLDSAGKRAAFAGFYAPIHFLTIREIVRQLGAVAAAPESVIDLGCGTGVAGAAWAVECSNPPSMFGIDVSTWALEEARWNWRELGLQGRTKRQDLGKALDVLTGSARIGIVLGWSLNELDSPARARALDRLVELAGRGARVLVVEPIATSAAQWWGEFAARAGAAGARVDQWKFEPTMPAALEELDEAAGFRREFLSARSVFFPVS